MKTLKPTKKQTNFIKAFELKKNRKYIFLFTDKSGLSKLDMVNLLDGLYREGFTGVALRLQDMNGLKIIEQHVKTNS